MKPSSAENGSNENQFFPTPKSKRNLVLGEKVTIINGDKINNNTNNNGTRIESAVVGEPTRVKVVKSKLKTLAQIGEDWLYLALLGIIMAVISFSMDTIIALFLNTRLRLYQDLNDHSYLIQYVGWCLTPIVLVTFSSGFVHLCSPTVSIVSFYRRRRRYDEVDRHEISNRL